MIYISSPMRKRWKDCREHRTDGNSCHRDGKTIENIVDTMTDNSEQGTYIHCPSVCSKRAPSSPTDTNHKKDKESEKKPEGKLFQPEMILQAPFALRIILLFPKGYLLKKPADIRCFSLTY